MKVLKVNFPPIISDNQMTYFSYLTAYTEAIDAECTMQITNKISDINIRISPSHPKFLDSIIKGIKDLNNLYGITVEFSKSMKNSANINFNINK